MTSGTFRGDGAHMWRLCERTAAVKPGALDDAIATTRGQRGGHGGGHLGSCGPFIVLREPSVDVVGGRRISGGVNEASEGHREPCPQLGP